MKKQSNEFDSMFGITENEFTKCFQEAVKKSKEIKRKKGIPIAKYDAEKKAAYLQYANGKKEYIKYTC